MFAGKGSQIETHILAFKGDLYDGEIDVFVEAFIQDEQRVSAAEDPAS